MSNKPGRNIKKLMTAQTKYITSIIKTFSTYLESLNISSKLSEETTATFVKFLHQKKKYDTWPMERLEKFLRTEKSSSNAVVLIKRFIKNFTPYQVDIFLHQFLKSLKKDYRSNSTIKNYRSDISQLISLSGVNKIEDLFTQVNIKNFVKDQFSRDLKVGTVKRKLISIAQFSEWAEDEGLVKDISFWISDIEGLFGKNSQNRSGKSPSLRINKTKTTSKEVGFCKPTGLPLGRLDKSELSITKNINLSIINSNKGDVEIGGIEPPRLDLSSQPGKPAIPTSKDNISQINRQIKPKDTTTLLEEFLLNLKTNNSSKSTIKNYKSDINQLLSFSDFNKTTPHLELIITPRNLKKFIAFQTSKGLKQTSIRRKIVSITKFATWAEKRGVLKDVSLWIHDLAGKDISDLNTLKIPKTNDVKVINHDIELKLKSHDKSKRWSLPMPKIVKNKEDIGNKLSSPEHKSNLKKSLKDFATSINAKKNKTFLPYFNLVMIALFLLGVGYFGYQQFVKQAPDSLAYPTTPVRPNRELSFQGRLTDTAQNPITTASNMAFRLYDTGPGTGGTLLWDSSTCSVTPDQDGIFNVGLGDDCGSEISENVFTENSNVWLEVDVVSETLTPRQSIKTVAYAINSETVQGYPVSATGAATTNTILVMDSAGQVLLGEVSPTLKSTNGTFSIEAQALILQTSSGSNGDIILDPDGTGEVLSTGYFYAPGATFAATYAGGTSLVLKGGPSGTGNIQEWQDSSGTVLSVVDESGNLGIGTDSPLASLDIHTGISNEIIRLGTANIDFPSEATSPTHGIGLSRTLDGSLTNIIFSEGTSAQSLGIKARNDINFYGNQNLNVVFKESGNVGIGTTSPLFLLDVAGTASVNSLNINDAYTFPTVDGSVDYILQTDGAGAVSWEDPSAITGAGLWANTLNLFHPKNELASVVDLALGGTSTASANIHLMADGQAYFAGNVGVGTTVPGQKLEVDGNIIAGLNDKIGFRYSAGDATPYQYITANGISPLSFYNSYTSSTTAIAYQFYGTNSNNEIVTILNGGNVGIGTTAPGALFEVNGTENVAKARITSTSSGAQSYAQATGGLELTATGMNTTYKYTPIIKFGSTDPQLTTLNPKFLAGIAGYATETYDLDTRSGMGIEFFTTDNSQGASTTPTSRMVIDEAGNVGIGTTSPGALLDVGGAKFSVTNGGQVYMETSLEDKISMYDNRLGSTGMYGFGVEANTLYSKSPTYHRWYVGANADGGTSTQMELSSTRLYVNGNVGIGITAPGTLLHLKYATPSPTAATITSAQLRDIGLYIEDSSLDNVDGEITSGIAFGYGSTESNTGIFGVDEGASGIAGLGFATGNNTAIAERMRIDGNGNVGIGDSTPDAPLDVVGDVYISDGLSLYETAVSDGTVEATKFCTGDGETNCVTDFSSLGGGSSLFTDGGTITYLTSTTDDLALGGTDSTSPFFFDESAEILTLTNTTAGDSFRVNDVASDTTPFVIDADGNVGIGTTAPDVKLEVSGAIHTSRLGTYGTYNSAQVQGIWSISEAYPINTGSDSFGNQYGIGYAYNQNGGSPFAGEHQIVFTNNGTINAAIGLSGSGYFAGNVGIGTTSPAQKLTISQGDIQIDHTTFANQDGIIYKSSSTFIHNFNYGDNGTVTTNGANTFVGASAGNLTMGSTATGTYQGSYNTGMGQSSLSSLTTGYGNTGLGYSTLNQTTTGGANTAIGDYSLRNSTGNSNSTLGRYSLLNITSGSSNISLGAYSGRYEADGSTSLTSLNNSVLIGYNAKANASGDTNEIAIGYDVTGLGSNTVVLGNSSITTTALRGNVGIGTTSPSQALDIVDNGGGVNDSSFAEFNSRSLFGYDGSRTAAQIQASTAKHIVFDTNGANERMRITSDGNIGIGTTAPNAPLEINNATSMAFNITGTTTNDYDHGLWLDGKAAVTQGNSSWLRLNTNSSFTSGVYTPGVIRADGNFLVDTSAVINDSAITINDANRYIWTPSSGWGEYWNTTDNAIEFYGGGSQVAEIDLDNGYISGERFVDNSNSSYFLDPAAGGDSLIVAGNVGIGTTSPMSKLDVNGAIKLVPSSYTATPGSGSDSKTDATTIWNLGSTGKGAIYEEENGYLRNILSFDANSNAIDIGQAGTSLIDSIYLYSGSNGIVALSSGGSETMRLTGGNVGIGTTSPSEMLDVSGNATASGNITMGGQLQTGRFASTPTAIGEGSMIFNTTTNTHQCYNGTSWYNCGGTLYSNTNASVASGSYITVNHDLASTDLLSNAWINSQSTWKMLDANYQPAIAWEGKDTQKGTYRNAVNSYSPGNETGADTSTLHDGYLFDTFEDETKTDDTNTTVSIATQQGDDGSSNFTTLDQRVQDGRVGLAGGQTMSTATTDNAGNTYLGSNAVNDIYYYDRARDSIPEVQVELGIDPNWYNGVTLSVATSSAQFSQNSTVPDPNPNLTTTYNGSLVKASGRYSSGGQTIFATIKSPTTYDWTDYNGEAATGVSIDPGTSQALGATGVSLTFTGTNYNVGDVFKVASWFVEATGSTRGGKQQFPERSNVVATDSGVDIIDMDTQKLWMRLDTGDVNDLTGSQGATTIDSNNGNIYKGSGSNGTGLYIINFASDTGYQIGAGGIQKYSGGISLRNSGVSYAGVISTNIDVVNANVNDVSAAVIPNQPTQEMTVSGWGYIQGDDTTAIEETINLPYKFNNTPIVNVIGGSQKTTAPTQLSDCTTVGGTGSGLSSAYLYSSSENDFNIRLAKNTNTFSSASYFCYTWTATGTVSPKQFVAVATDGGATVINETDQGAIDLYYDGTYKYTDFVHLTNKGELYTLYDNVGRTNNAIHTRFGIAGLASDQISTTNSFSTTYNTSSSVGITGHPNDIYVTEGTSSSDNQSNTIYISTDSNVAVIQETQTRSTNGDVQYDYNGSVKYYTKDYISEEMVGDIRGMWPLNGNNTASDFEDVSVKANNLTGTNITSADAVSGVRGEAYDFDGSTEYLSCTDASCGGTSDLDGDGSNTTEWSVGAWIKPTTISVKQMILSKFGNSGQYGYVLYVNPSGQVVSTISSNGSAVTDFTSVAIIPNNEWTYIASIYDGESVKVYINGVISSNTAYSSGIFNNTTPFCIGCDYEGASTTAANFFNGLIDEPFVTATAISAQKIKQMYEVGSRALASHGTGLGGGSADDNQKLGYASTGTNIVGIAQPDFNNQFMYVGLNSTTLGGLSKIQLNSDTNIKTYTASANTPTSGSTLVDEDVTSLSVGHTLNAVGSAASGVKTMGFDDYSTATTGNFVSKTTTLPNNIGSAVLWVSPILDSDDGSNTLTVTASNDDGATYNTCTLVDTDSNHAVAEKEYACTFTAGGNQLKVKFEFARGSTKTNTYITQYGISWLGETGFRIEQADNNNVRLYNYSGETQNLKLNVTGAGTATLATPWTDGGSYLYATGYETLRMYDGGGTNYVSLSHDGTVGNIGIDGSTSMSFDSSGNVGIGTTSPGSKLHINNTTTDTSGNTYGGLNFTGSQTTAHTGTYLGVTSTPQFTATTGNTLTTMYGMYSNPINASSGTVTNLIGSSFAPSNNSSGTVGNIHGVQALPYKNGTGDVTNVYSIFSRVGNTNATGTITNAYGIYIDDSLETGTITNDWGIYQVDTGAKNYFGGSIGIATSAPAAKLSISLDSVNDPINYGRGIQITGSTSGGQQIAFVRHGSKVRSLGYLPSSNTFGFGDGNSTDASFTPNILAMDTNGNVGIGTTSPAFKLDVAGKTRFGTTSLTDSAAFHFSHGTLTTGQVSMYIDVQDTGVSNEYFMQLIRGNASDNEFLFRTDGTAHADGSFTGGGADVAEYYYLQDNTEEGDLVSIPTTINSNFPAGKTLEKSSGSSYDGSVIGIVSTNPGLVAGGGNAEIDNTYTNQKPIALAGRVPVKVSVENGEIKKGDPLTSSSTPGVAMKASSAGQIIGRALEDYDGTQQISDGVLIVENERLETFTYNDPIPIPNEGIGKIMTFVNTTYHDPNIYLTDTGNLIINKNPDTDQYLVTDTLTNNLIDTVGIFAKAVIANIQAGLITATKINTEELISPIINTSKINTASSVTISRNTNLESEDPVLVVDGSFTAGKTSLTSLLTQEATISGTITTTHLEATSSRIAALEVGMAELENIKATTAEIVNATVSGTLYASNIYDFETQIANSLQTPGLLDLITGQNESTASANYLAELYETTNSSGFEAIAMADLDLTLDELSLTETDVVLTGSALFIERYFKVNGAGYISDSLAVGNSIFAGNAVVVGSGDSTTQISNGIIAYTTPNPNDQILKIQPTGLGSIELLAGLVTLDDSGLVTVNGNFETTGNAKIGGTLLTDLIQPSSFDNPFQVQVAGIDTESGEVKESRFEIINEVGTPVATFSAQGSAKFAGTVEVEGGISIGSENLGASAINELETNKTAGTAIITSGASQVKIESNLITDNTMIYVTAVGSTNNQVMYVKSQLPHLITNTEYTKGDVIPPLSEVIPATSTEPAMLKTITQQGEFIVGFDNVTVGDVSFNWWVVN